MADPDADADPHAPAPTAGQRHRAWLLVAGGLLLAAAVLPSTTDFSDVRPIDDPLFAPPYLIGVALGLLGLCRSRRAFVRVVYALRIGLCGFVLWSMRLFLYDGTAAMFELTAAGLLVGVFGVTSKPDERRVAISILLVGAIESILVLPWALRDGAHAGLYLGVAGAMCLVISGGVWTSALPSPHPGKPPRLPPELPKARVVK